MRVHQLSADMLFAVIDVGDDFWHKNLFMMPIVFCILNINPRLMLPSQLLIIM
jgi:hypothetical protein